MSYTKLLRIANTAALLLTLSVARVPAQVAAAIPGTQLSTSTPGEKVLARRISLDITGVTLAAAIDEIGRRADTKITYAEKLVESAPRVTIRASDIKVSEALNRALKGTHLSLKVIGGLVTVVEGPAKSIGQGVIAGRVMDATTSKGIAGATVSVGADTRGITTGEDGYYRLTGIAMGNHTVTVKFVGYARQTRSVTVGEGVTVTVNFKLERSANVLDQVVVTGTIVQTELKAIPNAITVITAKQIEDRGITRIDQLFRGDVPGMFALNQGAIAEASFDQVLTYSRGVTSLSEQDPLTFAYTGFTNTIKTYLDGVEMANSQYLSQIDPQSIDRIEILTGPQASTLYGSNAINGVMQIFTKRGNTVRPHINLSLISGWVENNFSSARAPEHDVNLQLSGLEGRFSYSGGSSVYYLGPWTPAKQTTRIGGFGGARFENLTPVGRMVADITLRNTNTRNLQRADPSQATTGFMETGWYLTVSGVGLAPATTYDLNTRTTGFTVEYVPTSWWSHEVKIGNDVAGAETRRTSRGYTSRSDTSLMFRQDNVTRRSLNYATTVRAPLASFAQATITAGANGWQSLSRSSSNFSTQSLTGTLTGTTNISRQPGHNTGGFAQAVIGLEDKLFLTYGLRLEWNPDYGEDAQPNYAPRYGIAFTQEFMGLTAKIRASYGRSTRPPARGFKTVVTAVEQFGPTSSTVQIFGPFDYRLANALLGPEHQQGGEGGLELYFGSRASLLVTRYNQTVDGLIDSPKVDSVQSIGPCIPASGCVASSIDQNGYGYFSQIQYLNVGAIRNQGWELQGMASVGPFTSRGTYSWTKSRTIGITPKYRSILTSPQYQPGATFNNLPEHTWAWGTTYSRAATTLGFNMTGVGSSVRTFDDDFFNRNLSPQIRLAQNRQNFRGQSLYTRLSRPYSMLDINASHVFTAWLEGVLQIQNAADYYRNDLNSLSPVIGRVMKVGARVRS